MAQCSAFLRSKRWCVLYWLCFFSVRGPSLFSVAFTPSSAVPTARREAACSKVMASAWEDQLSDALQIVQQTKSLEIDPTTLPWIAAFVLLATVGSSVLPQPRILNDATLNVIIDGTFLQTKPKSTTASPVLRCVYKASRDGWSALDFHDKVDNLGSAVVACRARNGAVVGGYNPNGWRSSDDYYSSTTAFLWSLRGTMCTRYPVRRGGGDNAALYDYATGGPCFGTGDLQLGPPQAAVLGGFAGPDAENLATNAGNLRRGRATPGFTYDTDAKWPVRGAFALSEVEVYCR